jgi:hypothetical protein
LNAASVGRLPVTSRVICGNAKGKIASARGLPDNVAHAARDSIGTSLQVARHAPTGVAAQVRDVARDAFLSSMRITYACAVAVVLGAAIVAARFLPARAAEPPEEHELAEAFAVGAENAAN